MPIAFTNAMGTGLSLLMIDKLGRRYMMLRFLPFVALGMFMIATGMYIEYYTDVTPATIGQFVAFSGVLFFVLMFSSGNATPAWAINAEIFPIHLIGTASALATASGGLADFIVTSFFLIMLETDAGKVYSFCILGCNCLLAWLFIYFLVPETANKSIQENIK
eukprot:CAMPEP_0116870924 /NCGR_PEP_ID=MMETSP0463-20121206/1051_1 /TAXON_ID=181622 /ORGANISM="Strombidinopsis sp, Strain SopsisLIS2011" /LENGTH=162 /DNA_ID=CAMNT_0004508385 /DNA_START=862 /DNA_END=1350 /DNA_ORIENTATION=-